MEGHGLSGWPIAMLFKRLYAFGVPMTYLHDGEVGLLQFLRERKDLLQGIVKVLMPGAEDLAIEGSVSNTDVWDEFEQGCREGIRWAQWLMFQGDPEEVMKCIGQETGHVRTVCGAVWGKDDIAYRCRTCENDPTCAICVSCFESAKHINHDYSMIYTGGGCCDCGDMTAWKKSGCCSRHIGTGQAPPLSEALMSTFEPVMVALLHEWGRRLELASLSGEFSTEAGSHAIQKKVATQTCLALVEMLLSFCNCSESMLASSGNLIASHKIGLLDLLLKSEWFLPEEATNKLHELLFKLMGNSSFKCSFAKRFINHYPNLILEGLRQSLKPHHINEARGCSALSSFSVQIFTVPTLTLLLVKDLNLLDMLLEALKDAFLLCSGGDAQQLVRKGRTPAGFLYRILADVHHVLSNADVSHYVAHERFDLLLAWLQLLAFTECMDSQQRQTSIHVEEETENHLTAFVLELQLASIHPLLIDGAAKIDSSGLANRSLMHGWVGDENVSHGNAKIGRTYAGSDASGKTLTINVLSPTDVDTSSAACLSSQGPNFLDVNNLSNDVSRALTVSAVLQWLIAECSELLEIWFLLDKFQESPKPSRLNNFKLGFKDRKGLHQKWRKARAPFRIIEREGWDTNPTQEHKLREGLRPSSTYNEVLRDQGRLGWFILAEQDHAVKKPKVKDNQNKLANWWMDTVLSNFCVNAESLLLKRDWLDISFDVSQQKVSFHIPLHRFLAVGLQKSLDMDFNNKYEEDNRRSLHCQDHNVRQKEILLQLFPTYYQTPSFISCLMEHPLRIQVLCAQIRAGMWRKNGPSLQALCERYHSVNWCEGSLDLDLFLLQCCGVLAPTDEFVDRIVSRFGLKDYFSKFLLPPNEYEPTVAQHMLVLLIWIIAERGLCGFTAADSCRRELIKRLATSDATHSQLMNSLPPRLLEGKQWEDSLAAVATYSNPSGMQQGKFILREECWKEMDLYHPRWNARDLQFAEDRYFRSCKVSSIVKQFPKWHEPFPPFENLSKIATCEKVHNLLRTTFFHAVISERIYENVLITALHLLALGLDACSLLCRKNVSDNRETSCQNESGSCDAQEAPPLLKYAAHRVDFFTNADNEESPNRHSLISLLVMLMQKFRGDVEAHRTTGEFAQGSIRALAKFLLQKLSDLHSSCKREIERLAPEILQRTSPAHDDKACVLNTSKQSSPSEADRKKLLARERQAAVMAKMKAAQEKFVANCTSSQEQAIRKTDGSQSKILECISPSQHDQYFQTPSAVMCALCRDSTSNSPISILTFVQRSKLLAIATEAYSWDKQVKSKQIKTSFDESADDDVSIMSSEVQGPQTWNGLWDSILIDLNGEVNREGPIDVEALFDFLRGREIVESAEGSQPFAEIRLAETISDSVSDDSELEECISESSDSPNAFSHFSQLRSAEGISVAEQEDERAQIRQKFLVTVLLEYANILFKNHKDKQHLEFEQSSSEMHNVSRLTGRSTKDESHDHIGSSDLVGTHMSSCGHAVHQECLDQYRSSLPQRSQNRQLFERSRIADPNLREFLCPVCRRLANSVLPVLMEAAVTSKTGEEQAGYPNLRVSQYALPTTAISLVTQAINLLQNAEELFWKSRVRKAVSKSLLLRTVKSTFDSLFHTLFSLDQPRRESNRRHSSNRRSQSLLLWNSLRYTIISEDLASRASSDAHSSKSEPTIEVLLKAADEGSMLRVLLQAAKAVQNYNRQTLLLRARGMQLLVGSICFGVSQDSLAQPLMPGSVSKLLHLIDDDKDAADIHFWRRTADPVLVHDPFSSLFWIMFCLPLSFPASKEPFLALVHLLYLVCIFQIIACLESNVLSSLTELQLTPSACLFVQTMSTKLSRTRIFHPLNDQTSDASARPLLLTMRRFTLPYLRRCALLGKLICNVSWEETWAETSTVHDFIMSNKGIDRDNFDNNSSSLDIMKDLKELECLEQRFSLPPLQNILCNEAHHEIGMMWCNHLCKEVVLRKFRPVPRPALAIPFKLMDLPSLYQTLLQTYIREKCPACSSVPEQPALCLLCGTLCCGLGCHPCCRQSECFRHAVACNGGVGVFLMIKKTNVFLQGSVRQAFWPSPYLDAFGEEDIEMSRGKPLYLNEDRYLALTKMVASHGLDQISTNWETRVWG